MGSRIQGNAFDNMNLDMSALEKEATRPGSATASQNGLTDVQRFITKNFFDTQPKMRKEYFRQLGYELGKDNESYRPLGMNSKFASIEPGENGGLGDWFSAHNPFTEAGGKEIARDFGDMFYDITSGVATGAAAIKAGALGTAVAGPVGGAAGLVLGGAASNVASESFKNGMVAMLTDVDTPMDKKELMYQSMTAGVMTFGGAKLGKMMNAWKSMSTKAAQGTLKKAVAQKAGPGFNDELLMDFMEKPQNYTPELVKGRTKGLLSLKDEIYGTSTKTPHSTRKLTGGLAKKKITPLNRQADLEMERLSLDPEANFDIQDMRELIRDKTFDIRSKKFNTADEEDALAFFRAEDKKLRLIAKKQLAKGELMELDFGEGRDALKSWQNAGFKENSPLKDNEIVLGIGAGLKEVADKKAGELGSNLPAINFKRAEILNNHADLTKVLKDGSIQNAFIGKDTVAKENLKRILGETDRILDTDLSNKLQSGQFGAAVEGMYSPAKFGTGNTFMDGLKEGSRQAPSEAFRFGTMATLPAASVGAPALIPAVAAVGATKGFVSGFKQGKSFSSPDSLIKQVSKIKTKISDLAEGRVRSQVKGAGAFQTVENLNQGIAPQLQAEVEGAAQIAEQTGLIQPQAQQAPPAQAPAGNAFDNMDINFDELQ